MSPWILVLAEALQVAGNGKPISRKQVNPSQAGNSQLFTTKQLVLPKQQCCIKGTASISVANETGIQQQL